jgi:hypothetical protein
LLAEFPLEIANNKSAAPETLTKPQFAIFTTEKQVAVRVVPFGNQAIASTGAESCGAARLTPIALTSSEAKQ